MQSSGGLHSDSKGKGDFFVNQVLTGHGAFGDHQSCFFRGNPVCFCGTGNKTISHCVYECSSWRSFRENHFPREFHNLTLADHFLDHYSRKEVAAIVSDLVVAWVLELFHI